MATREQDLQVPKSFFPYIASLGGHPAEKQTEVYVTRKDPLTKKVKCIPDMVSPIIHGRKPIPAHQLIEDDYRAFRSAAHFFTRLAACPQQAHAHATSYPVYDSHLPPIMGYLYSHHQSCHPVLTSPDAPTHIPVTVFKGPFQDMVNVPDYTKSQRQKARSLYHPNASLVLGSHDVDVVDKMRIYNEPDVIPQCCLNVNFEDKIVDRSMRASHLLPPIQKNKSK